jgi:hypothetical protein
LCSPWQISREIYRGNHIRRRSIWLTKMNGMPQRMNPSTLMPDTCLQGAIGRRGETALRWANVKKTLKGQGIDLDSGNFMRPWPIAERHGRLCGMLERHFACFGKCQLQRARSRKSLKRFSLFH